MSRYCIVVPVYNHPHHLPVMVGRLEKTGLTTLLVNDGSTAECSDVLHRLAAENDWIVLIDRKQNGGKGRAVKDGLQKALGMGFTHAIQIDADGQHDEGDIPRLLAASEKQPGALISGSPKFEAIPRLRFFGRYLTHVWVWINTLSLEIEDSMCGFRVYPLGATCAVLDSSRTGDRMDFDPEILVRLHWAGVPVLFVPTTVSYPAGGVSHFRGFRDNALISWMHTRLFFGMLVRLPMLLHRKARRRA